MRTQLRSSCCPKAACGCRHCSRMAPPASALSRSAATVASRRRVTAGNSSLPTKSHCSSPAARIARSSAYCSTARRSTSSRRRTSSARGRSTRSPTFRQTSRRSSRARSLRSGRRATPRMRQRTSEIRGGPRALSRWCTACASRERASTAVRSTTLRSIHFSGVIRTSSPPRCTSARVPGSP